MRVSRVSKTAWFYATGAVDKQTSEPRQNIAAVQGLLNRAADIMVTPPVSATPEAVGGLGKCQSRQEHERNNKGSLHLMTSLSLNLYLVARLLVLL